MVDRDYFKVLSDEEKARYKFEFCVGCAIYDKCELVEPYVLCNENYHKIHESRISKTTDQKIREVTEHTITIGGTETYRTPPKSTSDNNAYNLETKRPSYDPRELDGGCCMKSVYFNAVICGNQRVTEGIGDHYKIETQYDGNIITGIEDRWEPSQPVFISAQTGQGKNYFIENTLIPYVRELNYSNRTNQRILILSNRLALKQQIKNRLAGYDEPDEDEAKVYSYGDFADVMTYQSVLNRKDHLERIQKNKSSRYIFVICDEAHFFTSDAMFNPHTDKILDAIVRLFRKAIRVYMSATPYECLKYIDKYEKQGKMVLYHFKRDYNYLDVKAYSEITELYELIANSIIKKKEKWLIFIDDTAKCESVKKELGQYKYPERDDSSAEETAEQQPLKGKILDVSADSKSDEAYMSIIKNEKLSKDIYVLITTSVLDNGVNLSGIKNIVISDMSKVKCLQMAGRARVSDPADRKTLYVKRFRSREVNAKINALERQKYAYHRYDLAYGEGRGAGRNGKYRFFEKYYNGKQEDWLNAKHWFGRRRDDECDSANPELYINEIARSLLDRHITQYKTILEEINDEESILSGSPNVEKHIGQAYLEYQLAWFGKTYCVDDDITFADKDKAKTALIAFLESYLKDGQQISGKDIKKAFRDTFTKLYDEAFGRPERNLDRSYDIVKINRLLESERLGYTLVNHKSNWIVQKCDGEQE